MMTVHQMMLSAFVIRLFTRSFFCCFSFIRSFVRSSILLTGALGMPNNDASAQPNSMKWTCMAQTEKELACIEVTEYNTKAHAACNIIISQIYVFKNNKPIKNEETKRAFCSRNTSKCMRVIFVFIIFITSF